MSDPEHELQTELGAFLHARERRLRQFPRALLIGVIAGLVGVAFRHSLDLAELARNHLLARFHQLRWGFVPTSVCIVVVVIAAVELVRRLAPEASGSGIPHVKAVLYQLQSMRWKRLIPVKFMGGLLGIGSGLALGREGPTIQMGSAIGQMVARWLRSSVIERQTLIAAGAGAGLAAAFNAPLAGMVFVLEEVQRDFTPTVFVAALVASVTADVVTRLLTNQLPVFHLVIYPTPPLSAALLFPVLGAVMGVLGVVFNRGLLASLDLFARLNRPAISAAIVGLLVAVVAWFRPDAVGGGYALLDGIFKDSLSLSTMSLLFVVGLCLTLLSYGCGAAGGIFAPLLISGALAGSLVGHLCRLVLPGLQVGPQVFAVVGMGAYFSAIVRAPLTGIVLLLEMTENYNQMLPLLIACMAAYAVAEGLRARPIYESILERDLLRSRGKPDVDSTVVLELTVKPEAPFVGLRARSLDLPDGCLILSVRRGIDDRVPTKETVLASGDRLTVVIPPEAAAAAIGALRRGTGAA